MNAVKEKLEIVSGAAFLPTFLAEVGLRRRRGEFALIQASCTFMLFAAQSLIFFLGTAVGSFLNTLVLRLGKEEIRGRSHCPHCGKILEWFELIPLLSFFLQKGRCRSCRALLSWQYPFVEFLTGVLFLLVFWKLVLRFPGGVVLSQIFFSDAGLWIWPLVVLWWYYVSALIAISVYDIRHYLIPDSILQPSIFIAILGVFYQQMILRLKPPFFPESGLSFAGPLGLFLKMPFGIWGSYFMGVLVSVGLLGALWFFSKGRAMGFGDVKLGILLGILLGWPDILVALFIGFGVGAIFGSVAIFLKKKTMKSYLPFGPFLVLGALSTMLVGDWIVQFWFYTLPSLLISV